MTAAPDDDPTNLTPEKLLATLGLFDRPRWPRWSHRGPADVPAQGALGCTWPLDPQPCPRVSLHLAVDLAVDGKVLALCDAHYLAVALCEFDPRL